MIRFNCGSFWPYRFVTKWWEILYREHNERLRIETNTAVTEVTYDESSQMYKLTTPRGIVTAKTIFHATNGYTGHLLPNLRGKIIPVLGFMSAQETPPKFGNYGRDRTWSFFGSKTFDETTGVQESGVYYGNQSPEENTLFWGGDRVPVDRTIDADDSAIPSASREDLAGVLPKQFTAWAEGEKPIVKQIWSGIQGYTADHVPLIGVLPSSVTHRAGQREIVCAGFNGAGMCQCWSSGEAAVKIAMGESPAGVVPEFYLATEERLNAKGMTGEAAVEAMFGGEWNH